MATSLKNKKKKSEQTENQSILLNVQKLDINQVVNDVSSLQLSIQNTLANLSAELANKLQQIEQVDAAIALKEDRLHELFEIEKEQMSIEEIKAIREYEEEQNEIAKKEFEDNWKNQEQERSKAWLREKEEYDYKKTMERKKAEDEFNNQMFVAKRNEDLRKATLENSWKDRESILLSKENEFAVLQAKVADFDNILNQTKASVKEQITSDLGKEYGYKINMVKKEAEGDIKLKEQEINSQQHAILGMRQQIESLELQLKASRNDAKEVATQALQSASGRQVVEALQKANSDRDSNSKNK